MSGEPINEPVEFVSLLNHNNYEILNHYPFTIRKRDTHDIVNDNQNAYGYIVCSIDKRTVLKHVLIAKQFIPNPDNLPEVDHINRDRSDFHLSNLRWVSRSTNMENRTSCKGIECIFVDDIPDDAIKIEWYETRTQRRLFEANKYYYYRNGETDEDVFYAKITDKIRFCIIITINQVMN